MKPPENSEANNKFKMAKTPSERKRKVLRHSILWPIVIAGTVLFIYFLPTAKQSKIHTVIEEGDGKPELQIPLGETEGKRLEFARELVKIEKFTDLRPVYEKYIDVIGANGILDIVQKVNPKCHSEGHDLGKVIYAKLRDIGASMRTCQDGCYSGCMHGVFMEVFKLEADGHSHHPGGLNGDEHKIVQTIKARIPEICYNKSVSSLYREGECAHAVGHAIMFVLNYDIPRSIDHCKLFDTAPMDYYCATGAYMEYVSTHGMKQKEGETLFYPCDTEDFPAACFRYKLSEVFRAHFAKGGQFVENVQKCMELNGKYRLGCFHGVGNAHMGNIAEGNVPITYVCGFGSEADQYMCIEGAVERIGKFHPEKALLRCQDLDGWRKEVCLAAANRKMYSLEKSWKYYF